MTERVLYAHPVASSSTQDLLSNVHELLSLAYTVHCDATDMLTPKLPLFTFTWLPIPLPPKSYSCPMQIWVAPNKSVPTSHNLSGHQYPDLHSGRILLSYI